jgi:predicted heme/steroid binding protein
MHFILENRAEFTAYLKAKRPSVTPKELNCAVAKLAGERWRALDEISRRGVRRRAMLAAAQRGVWRRYTVQQIANHSTADDCWLIVDGRVYDVTDFVEGHPGGFAILNQAGRDSSVGFHGEQHPEAAAEVLSSYFIGELLK